MKKYFNLRFGMIASFLLIIVGLTATTLFLQSNSRVLKTPANDLKMGDGIVSYPVVNDLAPSNSDPTGQIEIQNINARNNISATQIVNDPKIDSMSLDLIGDNLVCSWTSENTDHFYIEILNLRLPNSVWLDNNYKNNSYSIKQSLLEPDGVITCNIQGFNSNKSTEIIGRTFKNDVASATINLDRVNSTYDGRAVIRDSLRGSFSYIDAYPAFLHVQYYVVGDNEDENQGKYIDASSNWTNSVNWIEIPFVNNTPVFLSGQNSFSTNLPAALYGPEYFNVKFRVTIKDEFSDRTLWDSGEINATTRQM